MSFELPELKYDYDALEPVIDAQTMEIHYTKHHQGYTNKLNAALNDQPDLLEKSIEELLSDLDALPSDLRRAVQNNGGGYYNHKLFWETMTPKGNEPSNELVSQIEESFDSFEAFKEEFTEAALTRFGSGWAWLVLDGDVLKVVSTANQDNPISQGMKPILGLDVWEHAYYLNYQNKRAEYIENWWSIVDWAKVEELLS